MHSCHKPGAALRKLFNNFAVQKDNLGKCTASHTQCIQASNTSLASGITTAVTTKANTATSKAQRPFHFQQNPSLASNVPAAQPDQKMQHCSEVLLPYSDKVHDNTVHHRHQIPKTANTLAHQVPSARHSRHRVNRHAQRHLCC
jgi:hypothetical protein